MSWKEELIQNIKDHLEGYTACHDFYHGERVLNNALKIAKKIECDPDILFAAALTHDVGYKNIKNDDNNHHKYSMGLAKKWLIETDFPKEKIEAVLEAIEHHDNHAWGHDPKELGSIEARIVQDADRIDALGAVGIARITYYYGERGFPIVSPAEIPQTNKVWINHSLLELIRRDTLRKWEHLNFEYSKEISAHLNKFAEDYYNQLKKELTE